MFYANADASFSLLPERPTGQWVTTCADQTIVWLSGEQDAATADTLAAILDVEAAALATAFPGASLIVDVTALSFLDASILNVLMNAHANRALQVRGRPRCLRRLVEICASGEEFVR